MKLKLISSLGAGLFISSIIPACLSGCSGYKMGQIKNVLKEFKPYVESLEVCDFLHFSQATSFYSEQANNINDIVASDMLYTWSWCLTNNESRQKIERVVSFSKYEMGVSFAYQEKFNHWVPIIKIWANVAGEAKDIYLDWEETKKLNSFDLSLSAYVFGRSFMDARSHGIPFNMNEFCPVLNSDELLLYPNAEEIKTCPVLSFVMAGFSQQDIVPNSNPYGGSTWTEMKAVGSYSYTENDNKKTVDDLNVNQAVFPFWDGSSHRLYADEYINNFITLSLFNSLVFNIPRIGLDIDMERYISSGLITFISPYLKNVNVRDIVEE